MVFLVSLVNAEILFGGNLKEVYNVEDSIAVNFSIDKKISSSGFVSSSLKCNSEEMEVYRKYHLIEKDKRGYIQQPPTYPTPSFHFAALC